MKILENKSSFADEEIVKIARRENNTKRSYLLVNSVQGKHVPVSPEKPLKLFTELGEEVKKYTDGKNTLFIGFAETATAVGVGVAGDFKNSRYMHTTREYIDSAEMVAEFREEHSHAVQQTLQCNNWKELTEDISSIIFVEDEISTGKTIENFVKALKNSRKVPESMSFSACSVINGMTDERTRELKEAGIEFYYLMKISMADYTEKRIFQEETDQIVPAKCTSVLKELTVCNDLNPRTGVNTYDYINTVLNLAENVAGNVSVKDKSVAVIGTEECMYPAIKVGEYLLNNCVPKSVKTHSATRSPIEPHSNTGYPLARRCRIKSLYDSERTTFIYNTDYYDKVIIITDSDCDEMYIGELMNAFDKCSDFMLVRFSK